MSAAATLSALSLNAAGDIEINNLGVNNTLVRIKGDSRYVLLPVQESNEDARINVIVDGKIVETIYVRMATSRTDFTVSYDLSPYKGKNVILDVVTPQSRSSVREAKGDVCWKNISLTDTLDLTDRELQYRPLFHHTPQYGWMNDPNGMFYKDGVWHLYYQWNPYGSKWQNLSWGHSTSTDLINWEHQPVALTPDGLGYIFSGSSAIDHNNTAGFGEDAVVAIYTSAGTNQMQSLAYSNNDGADFTVLTSNPIITLESEARDPNFFWNEQTGEWNLALAHALDHEMLFFTSPDLKNWTLQSSFGKGLGAQDGVWECPDLFRLPVDGTDKEKWVLICNINPGGPFGGSGVQYFVGDWDGKKFTVDTDADGKVPTKWLDHGKDNYALVSWSDTPDGRRTAIGWMSNWDYAAEVPTSQYRSANTLPRELSLFTASDGQIYMANVPSPEVISLRDRLVTSVKNSSLNSKDKVYNLPAVNDGVCEFTVDFNAETADSIMMTLSNKAGEHVDMVYNPATHTLSFDRRNSGNVGFSDAFPVVTVAPTHETDGKVSLRVFIDRSSIELFGNEGRFSMTNLVFPTHPYTTLEIKSLGGKARMSNLRIYSIKLY
ncbi:MAG: DUF4980 domain-containing protein [Bacteroidales bacterium]|nr:DUF4980 domain-containing protein [Bacteroidales bacterium]